MYNKYVDGKIVGFVCIQYEIFQFKKNHRRIFTKSKNRSQELLFCDF